MSEHGSKDSKDATVPAQGVDNEEKELGKGAREKQQNQTIDQETVNRERLYKLCHSRGGHFRILHEN